MSRIKKYFLGGCNCTPYLINSIAQCHRSCLWHVSFPLKSIYWISKFASMILDYLCQILNLSRGLIKFKMSGFFQIFKSFTCKIYHISMTSTACFFVESGSLISAYWYLLNVIIVQAPENVRWLNISSVLKHFFRRVKRLSVDVVLETQCLKTWCNA